MDIRDLRCFCMVAEMEHVSKAADKLGVAQPYLTKLIGQIENEFGIQLFLSKNFKNHLRIHQDIINENYDKMIEKRMTNSVHQVHKSRRSVSQPKGITRN